MCILCHVVWQTRFHMPFDFFRGLDFRGQRALAQATVDHRKKRRESCIFFVPYSNVANRDCCECRAVFHSLFKTIRLLFGEDDKRVRGAFIKSIKFIEILWTKTIKTALYCLPWGFAGGRILISLCQGLFKARGTRVGNNCFVLEASITNSPCLNL